jgi:spore coat-associated protein N
MRAIDEGRRGLPGTGVHTDVPAQEARPEHEPSRFDMLLRNRTRLLLVVLLLLLAVGVAVGSSAVFTSSSVNPDNTFTSGTLSQSNSKEGAAILTASGMVPGQSSDGTVTIKNTGDVSGAFTLSASGLTDNPGPNGGKLSDVLKLKVVDMGPGTTVYDGPFASMPKQNLGSWAPAEQHSYRFTVTFPNGGTPPSETTGDNAYQGSSTSVTYTWDATSQ